ncbi:MAG: HD domain-containing protein, partial [bacterium]
MGYPSHGFRFWAKTGHSGEQLSWHDTHLVICHMIDVGVVCEAFLKGGDSGRREYFASALRSDDGSPQDDSSAIRKLSVAVGAHDIGKLSPFQEKADLPAHTA